MKSKIIEKLSRLTAYADETKRARDHHRDLNDFALAQLGRRRLGRDCPGCGSSSFSEAFRAPIYRFVTCNSCSLVYARDTFTADTFASFYENNEYYQQSWRAAFESLRRRHEAGALHKPAIVDRILSATSERGKLLDIGCGFGEILHFIAPHFESVEGVELNVFTSRAGADLFNLKIHNTDLENAGLSDNSYDCIVLNQVIEHLNSLELFHAATRLLRPGGTLFVSCPYMNSASMKMFSSHHVHVQTMVHVNMFTKEAFARFAEKFQLHLLSAHSDGTLDIQLSDIIGYMSGDKEFCHRFHHVRLLSPLNIALLIAINKLESKTNIVAKLEMGSYIEAVFRK